MEKEAALKVIRENELERRGRENAKLVQKKQDAQAISDEIAAMEAKERKRLEEVRLRYEKIENVMTKMGDVIVHKDKEL